MARKLISKWQSPQVTALDHDEFRDLEAHPDKSAHYGNLVKQRTLLGKDFETKVQKKKRGRNV